MDGLFSDAGKTLVSGGLSGIVILGLAWALWRIFRMYTEVQEKRVSEALQYLGTIKGNTEALERLSELLRDRIKS